MNTDSQLTIKEMRQVLIAAETIKYQNKKNSELALKRAVEQWERMSDELIVKWHNAFFVTVNN